MSFHEISAVRGTGAHASTPAKHAGKELGFGDGCSSSEADADTLARLSDAMDALQKVIGRLTARRGQEDKQAGQTSGAALLPSSPGAARNEIRLPLPGEELPWNAHLRADIPRYVMEQLRAEAYRTGRTAVSVLLRAMSAFHDADGNAVFCIREGDMVADRRKEVGSKKQRQVRSDLNLI